MADGDFDRVPPQDLEAEASTLGSMLLSREAITTVEEILRGSDFYAPANETIFNTISELSARGEPADAITTAAELNRNGDLQRVGGATYLHSLVAGVPTATSAEYYARIVRERSVLRRLVSAGTRIAQLGYADEGSNVEELVDRAQAEIYAVSERRSDQDYVSLSELADPIVTELDDIQRNKGQLKGVPTGFRDLDRLTQGLHPGQMVIVAARPAMGKSTLALDFCRSASIHHGVTSIIFSLEMSRSEITMRLLSAESGVWLSKMQSGNMNDHDWRELSTTIAKISTAPFFIDDSPNMAMNEIRAKCRRLKQQQNLGLVVIDYLQLMSSSAKVESRQQEVSGFSRQLKLLAKEIEVPVVAVAQLNRGPEQRTDKKPMMADLRESGSLEQDADVVILLNRPDYYDKEERPGEADIIVAKHRNGQTDTIRALFQGHLARFVDFTDREAPEEDAYAG